MAKDYPEKDFDLVAFFDCLHDMGDPSGAAAHVRQSLKSDGSLMIVELMAGDRLEENLNPVGRIYYAGSTMGCVPTLLPRSQAGGAQGGGFVEGHARSDRHGQLPRREARRPADPVCRRGRDDRTDSPLAMLREIARNP
jgi:hypothetical protein